jgi:uncharacterized cupredoxin-like copper-binding protein
MLIWHTSSSARGGPATFFVMREARIAPPLSLACDTMRRDVLKTAPVPLVCLLLTLGPTASADEGPPPTTVSVVMADYSFTPDHLVFQHGMPYRLHLENHGKETHEFTAPVFFASAQIDNPDVLTRARTEIVMQPGDVKDLFLIAPAAPGTYDLRCSDHDWAGMVGGIAVE